MKIDIRYAIVAGAAFGPMALTRAVWFLSGLPWEPVPSAIGALVILSFILTFATALTLFLGGDAIEREFRWFK